MKTNKLLLYPDQKYHLKNKKTNLLSYLFRNFIFYDLKTV
ncbi:hypothetical protein PRABACTJOHN_01847 [Parabacteroides johnsonii DSM 18315]|uniref:Uncharacterized protein n=1 Tax=Parabacteroides johnsonii DSM 18315 TaxID=537006 RepID=B7B9Z2_9BACT|nr:hypothetical protein PRABACTJOHN_01847 [Parabacteroides johnsonii DSM 18315]